MKSLTLIVPKSKVKILAKTKKKRKLERVSSFRIYCERVNISVILPGECLF